MTVLVRQNIAKAITDFREPHVHPHRTSGRRCLFLLSYAKSATYAKAREEQAARHARR